ncbi:HU family DNA-binding protein [Roseobacteraceae bacterium NS-SX3]
MATGPRKAGSSRTGQAKPATASKTGGKAAAEAAPQPVALTAADAVAAGPAVRKKELVEQAVLRSGVKKKDAKPVVEAVLDILGEAVAGGRDLNLQPFGKLRINRSQSRSNGTVHACRLRQPAGQPGGEENASGEEKSLPDPLAEAGR